MLGMSDEKVALVTGAGSGIGRAAALALARAGFAAVLAGRRREPLEETARAIESHDGTAYPVPTDVSSPGEVAALFSAIEDRYGRLDVLFNNAGVGSPTVPFEDITFDQWHAVVSVNLTGMFLCAQGAFRIMKHQIPRGGRIINNGSLSSYSPRPLSAPYTATKHAVTGLTRACALDGRPYDIAVGQIDIGNAATSMTSYIGKGALQADGSARVEPFINVDLVADAVVQMASLPLDANILSMTVMATAMPFVGRG